jgi:hypothetical protein
LSVLDRASRIVGRKFPGSVLEVGELSRRTGGRIPSHLSHQNGRDADVAFYLVDLDGEPIRAPRYLRFESNGESKDDPTVRFDDKRNWAFVRAVLQDPKFQVRQIFIYAPLRARLLAFATRIGAPLEIRAKAAAAMMQPGNALPHDDHFHIRISCPTDQVELGCLDLPVWRPPDLDEYGPEPIAEAPSSTSPANVPLEAWGSLLKLWSNERAVCDKVEPACSATGEGPMCEDLGTLGLPSALVEQDEVVAAAKPTAKLPTLERTYCTDEMATVSSCRSDDGQNVCSATAPTESRSVFALQ